MPGPVSNVKFVSNLNAPNAPARQKRFKVCPIKSVGTIMCATITLVCIIRSTDEALETFPCLFIAEFLVKSRYRKRLPKIGK